MNVMIDTKLLIEVFGKDSLNHEFYFIIYVTIRGSEHENTHLIKERSSTECRKTKTKVITLANHNRGK